MSDLKKVLFKDVHINHIFYMNGHEFKRVETAYTRSCCVPEHNAYNTKNKDHKVLVPFSIEVEIKDEPFEHIKADNDT